MSIGTMRHQIEIKEVIKVQNENGYETEELSTFKKVWTSVENLSGREYFLAAQVQQEKTLKFTIRALDGLSADMKIVFKDRLFNIIDINNLKYANKFIEIKAMEVEASG